MGLSPSVKAVEKPVATEPKLELKSSLTWILSIWSEKMLNFAFKRCWSDVENAQRHQAKVAQTMSLVFAMWSKESILMLNASMKRWKAAVETMNSVERAARETRAWRCIACWLCHRCQGNRLGCRAAMAFSRWKSFCASDGHEKYMHATATTHENELKRMKTQQEEMLAKPMEANGTQVDHFARLQREFKVATSLLRILSTASKDRFLMLGYGFKRWWSVKLDARQRE